MYLLLYVIWYQGPLKIWHLYVLEISVDIQLCEDGLKQVQINGGPQMIVQSHLSLENNTIIIRSNVDGIVSSASIILQDNTVHLFSVASFLVMA